MPEVEDDHADSSLLACCCGKRDCAFLAHSSKLLEKVKRDARTAGELGQVCAILALMYKLLATDING
jgi:hypothetical protein